MFVEILYVLVQWFPSWFEPLPKS